LCAVIANKPKPLPYLDALLPKDYELESEQDDDKRIKHQERREKVRDSQKTETPVTAASAGMSPGRSGKQEQNASADPVDSDIKVDNPYLRAIVMPKLKTASKKYR
jgi:hypothetical protein